MKQTRMLILPLALMAVLSACGDRDHDRDAATADAGTNAPDASATAADANGTAATASADSASAPMDATVGTAADAGMTGTAGADGTTPATDASANAAGGDADLLGVLAAINQHEIDASNQAKQHKLDAAVSKYADMMITDHGANLTQTRALGANEQSAQATAQKEKGKQHLDQLGQTPDAQYQKAFVDAMVQGHTEALATLDNTLIPGAKDAKVKDHLQKTRDKVAQHLEQAKALQKQQKG